MMLDAEALQRVPFSKAEVTIYSITAGREFTHSIEKTVGGEQLDLDLWDEPLPQPIRTAEHAAQVGRTYRPGSMAWRTPPDEPEVDWWRHQYLPTSRLYQPGERVRYGEARVREEADAWDVVFARAVEVLWKDYAYRVQRTVGTAQGIGFTRILRAVLSAPPELDRGQSEERESEVDKAYAAVRSFLERQGAEGVLPALPEFRNRYESDDPTTRRIVHDIEEVEGKISEATAPQRRLQSLIAEMFTGPKTVQLSDLAIGVRAGDGEEIGLGSLSSGEKHALRIFVEALLAEDNAIMIDEPEISLHVQWQRRLISDIVLLNPGTQLIVATHSPEIMADVSDENVFRMP
jgi:hypothetical protein